MENSSDHEILPPITIFNAQTPYQKLVVPASMRSQYWRYFGFPADDSNNIITRTKIVCCICRRQIAYNKNTTNMSTHLIARHIDIMHKHFPNDIKPTPSHAKRPKLSKTAQASASLNKRIKKEEIEAEPWSDDDTFTKNRAQPETKSTDRAGSVEENSEIVRVFVTNEDDVELIETLDYGECSGIFGLDSPHFSGEEPNESNDHEFMNEEYLLTNVNADNEVSSHVTSQDGDDDNKIMIDVYVDNANKRSPKKSNADVGGAKEKLVKYQKELQESSKRLSEAEVADALKNFIVSDIMSPSIVDGVGFRSLLKNISGRVDIPIPNSTKIGTVIENDFKQKSAASLLEIESLGKNVWFSLAFDKWITGDGDENIMISFNYLVSQEDSKIDALKRQIVSIVSDNCTKYLNKQFKDFTKCSAAIVNWELDEKHPLRVFLQKKKIPIIQSFSSVIESTVKKCLELTEVESTFTLLADLRDDTEQKIFSPCWLTQFSRLNELSESTAILPDDHLLNTVKAITECLRPLKNCLEILSEESTTWASMMKPLAHSLISEHYTAQEKDADGLNETDKLINTMKTIVVKNLTEKITSNQFLTVASFLDPRFHAITSPEDRERIQASFSKNVKDGGKAAVKIEPEAISSNKIDTQKRNSLSLLFANLPVGQNSKTTKNRIETEIRSYTEDVNVEIDQCPLSWWSTSDMVYPNLKSHVHQYFSAPPFVNEFHRLPLAEQTQYREKFKKIENEIDRKIMWLHINSTDYGPQL